jgi:hypothetical protein
MITESDVKQTTIVFLKQYYKFRPHLSDLDNPLYDLEQADGVPASKGFSNRTTEARLDMMTDSGIMADGYLQFVGEDGQPFTATFEASAQDSDGEVRFRVHKKRLFWDAVSSSSMAVALFLCYFFLKQKQWLWSINGGILLLYLVAIFFIVNILHRKLLSWLPRYRRIFAIEQFKQYFVNEQWVSIAHDIFEHPEDEAMKELKKQCVENGFGLVVVDDDLKSHLHLTPAREVILKNRKSLAFFDKLSGIPIAQKVGMWQEKTINVALGKLELEKILSRFQTPFYMQMIVTTLASVVGITIFFKHINDTDKKYLDERTIVSDLNTTWKKENRKEDAREWRNVPQDAKPFNKEKDKKGWMDQAANEPMPANSEDEFTQKGIGTDGLYLTDKDGGIQFIECGRLELDGSNIVIKESTHPNLLSAQRRMNILKKSGIHANCVWMGCFTKSSLEYVVFLDLIFKDQKIAIVASQNYYKVLRNSGLDTRGLEVINLN